MSEIDLKFLESGKEARRIRLMNGGSGMIPVGSITGFCHNNAHKGFLTVTLMNKHNCVEKDCHYFERFKEYPYWIKYERRITQKEVEKRKSKYKLELKKPKRP